MQFPGRQGLLWTLVGLALCLISWSRATAALPPIGEPAPSFELEKVLQAPTNAPTRSADLRGSVVVLEF